MPEPADIELVERAKAGDLLAFEELVRRHERAIYGLALKMLRHPHDAEDVTQQAFLSALEHLSSFRQEGSFGAWLSRIAAHAALKVIRKRNGLETVSIDEAARSQPEDGPIPHPEFIADWRQSPDQLVHARELGQLLDEALAELDEKHRLVFLFRDVQGLSIAETADLLGISEANVKVRLLRARLQLRERLTRVLGDPATVRAPHRHSAEQV